MNNHKNIDNPGFNSLFKNKYKSIELDDFSHEMTLLQCFIEGCETHIENYKPKELFTFEGVCYTIAESIIEYAKTVYDNMLLGHFDVTRMIARAIIENKICLDIIVRYKKEELWKYYAVHSLRQSIVCRTQVEEPIKEELFEEFYKMFNIENAFLTERKKKGKILKPFIEENYGWTYKINKEERFSFSAICKLVDKKEYNDFKVMSEYSHGTALWNKINKSVFISDVVGNISIIYKNLKQMLGICFEIPDDVFFQEICEELELMMVTHVMENKL